MNLPPVKYRVILLAGVPLLGWLLLFDGGFIEQHGYHERLDSLTALRFQLEAENERIGREIQALKTKNPRMLEEEARRIGMVRPGDEVYYLVTDEDTTRLNRERRRTVAPPSHTTPGAGSGTTTDQP